jgi:hypothetical protein
MTPLYTSIAAIALLMDKSSRPDDALVLEFLKAHLDEANASTKTEIEALAVEGLLETYEDMMAQTIPANKKALYDLLTASVLSLEIQLIKEGQN